MDIPISEIAGKIAGIAVAVAIFWFGMQEAKKKLASKKEQKPSK